MSMLLCLGLINDFLSGKINDIVLEKKDLQPICEIASNVNGSYMWL